MSRPPKSQQHRIGVAVVVVAAGLGRSGGCSQPARASSGWRRDAQNQFPASAWWERSRAGRASGESERRVVAKVIAGGAWTTILEQRDTGEKCNGAKRLRVGVLGLSGRVMKCWGCHTHTNNKNNNNTAIQREFPQ